MYTYLFKRDLFLKKRNKENSAYKELFSWSWLKINEIKQSSHLNATTKKNEKKEVKNRNCFTEMDENS